MSVKYEDNTPKIKANTDSKTSLMLRYMIEDTYRIAEPRTPKEHGQLRSHVTRRVTGKRGTISWNKKYAAVQEAGTIKGRPITNYTTAGTGKKFAENAVREVVANTKKYVKKAGL